MKSHDFRVPVEFHDEAIFLEATKFVVVVCRDHWNIVLRKEFNNARDALEEARKHTRSLLYAITEVGRTAVFGEKSFARLEKILEGGPQCHLILQTTKLKPK